MIIPTWVSKIGFSGFLVPKHMWLRARETSTEASILEYGVCLGDIIPHIATFEHFPKKGSCPLRLSTPEDCEKFHLFSFHSAPQPILAEVG